ncbi:hypothetical protein NXX60_05925 [Bacteroides thetaiotaomicron]|nr:hypothetical protein NXX60_05925 [Bacteroides thetaiotaomicron]
MYTTYGTGFGKFSQTYHIGTRKYGHKPGHQEQKEKKTPSRRKPHGFLNTRIPSIAPDLYVENDRDVTVNVTTKENLDFLYRSAMKYAQAPGCGAAIPSYRQDFHKRKNMPAI